LLEEAGLPIAAPSANPSGRISATSAAHVAGDLAHAADLILDDGPTPLGIESTVVGWQDGQPVVLRPGAVARDAIEAITGNLGTATPTQVQSPGQLASHYAPRAKVRLNASAPRAGEAFLAFGRSPVSSTAALNLSPGGDLREAAANLFAMLRRLDAGDFETIAVMPIPDAGLGEAINDRLLRAAAPRDGAE
jgi:L-threonylcarbamoyladenylate synthase